MTKLGGGTETSTTAEEAVTVGTAAAAAAEEETATAMPAVTLTGTADADSGVTVTVEAPEGAFADGVTMTVETLTGGDAEAFLEAVAEQDFALYDETYTVIDSAILDISFYVNGVEVQPETDVTVTISGLDLATEADGMEANYALVYHMANDGTVEYVEDDQNEQAGLTSYSFTASDFSAYGIVNVNVEYGIMTAADVSNAQTTITYTYGSSNYNSSTATITVHFVDSTGAELSTATITYDSAPSYTTRNTAVSLSNLAANYTVTVDGTTYSFLSGYSKIATGSAAYSAATTASYFRYGQSNRTYYWQYSTNGSTYTNLGSSAITDIYLAYGDPSEIEWDDENTSINKGTADHIDIEVDTTATIIIDGVTYTASITLTESDFKNNVTVTARWNGQTFTDFTFDDSNITTSSSSANKSQYRVGGSYPVGTIDNPVEYQFTLRKTVTFTSADTTSTFDVTMDFVSDWFSYWQSTNACPGLSNSTTSWQNGNFISGSGLDFTLSASAEAVTIIVNKYIVDENNNLLAVDSAVNYDFAVYEDLDEDMLINTASGDGVVNTDTFTVAAGSSSDSYSTQVDPGYYCVIEDTDSRTGTTISVGGAEYTYSYTYTSSTGLLESTKVNGTKTTNDGQTAILQADATSTPVYNIYNVYVNTSTTSVTVTKAWDDSDDTYGLRPASVEVTLYQNDSICYINGVAATATLTDADGWTYTWDDLPVSDGTNDYEYTVFETAVTGYTSATTGDATNGFTITNTLDTGDLTLTKTVNADSSVDTTNMTFDFVVTVNLAEGTIITDSSGNTYTVSNGTITVSVPAGGSVALTDIPVGTYTVTESGESGGSVTANGHTWTVTDSGQTVTVLTGVEETATITNTVADEYTIIVTKYWVDSNNANDTRPATDEFTVTLTGNDGSIYTISSASGSDAAWSSSSTSTSDYWNTTITVPAYNSSGNPIVYTISETSVAGYSLDYVRVGSTAISYTDYTGTDTIYAAITPAEGHTYVTLQNSLDTASIEVTKTLLDSDGYEITSSSVNDDDFTMRLYTYDDTTQTYTQVAARTLTLAGVMKYTFSDLPLGTYYLKEELAGDNLHAYTVTVTGATANADGYYVINLTTADATVEVSVTNQEQEIDLTKGTTAFPSATKTFTSSAGVTGMETEFTFYVMDANGVVATGTAKTTVNAANPVDVTWTYETGAFTYTEVGTYVYNIYEEDGLAAGISYSGAVYTLVVTVSRDENGDLTASSQLYSTYDATDSSNNVTATSAAFVNTYDPDSITYTMIVRKTLTGRTIQANEFSVNLQQYQSDFTTKVDDAITVYNTESGTFSHTFTYGSVGTYYYRAVENPGTETGMAYDNTIYWVKIVVTSDNGVLKVSSVQYVGYDPNTATQTTPTATTQWTDYSGGLSDITAFLNEYTASGSTTLTAYKSLTGRALNAGEFTFLLVALDTGAPMPTGATTAATGNTYVADGYVVAGQRYVTATNNAEGTISFGSITYTEADIGKTYTYRVKEIVGDLPGVTYDTAETGKLIYVRVEDAGNGELTITVTTSGSEDKNGDNVNDVVIYNTFSQGETSVVGTKTWVDGGLTHENASEVKLKLYRTTDTTITGSTVWTEVTTDRTGTSIVGIDGYINTVAWTTASTWTILNLPMYDESCNLYVYKVEETISGYTVTYGVYGTYVSGESSYINTAITNTIAQDYVTLTGTKTWVDGLLEHSANNITLIVTRDGTALTEGTDYVVTWTQGTSTDSGEVWLYTITAADGTTGLDKYDLTTGAAYTYTVEESNSNGTVTVGGYTYTVTQTGNDITNTRQPEDPTTSKTVEIGDGDTTDDNGETVAVDDEITYTISYYNGNSTEATVTITDVLDNGVTYVSATDPDSWTGTAGESYAFTDETTGTSYNYGGTVTWTFTAAAFESGTVTLTVTVNDNAKVAGDGLSADWDDTATVDNQATVVIADNELKTKIVTNPLEDDDPTDPEKSIYSVVEPQYDNSGNITSYETQVEEDGTTGNLYVSVDDRVTYNIIVTNNTSTTQTYYVIDTLDEGVDYVSSGLGSTYTADGTTITTSNGDSIIVPAHSVYWQISVYPFRTATLVVTVKVNENAKTAAQTYSAVDPDTGLTYTDYTYDGTASIANQASVYMVSNKTTTYTDVIENPLEEEEAEDPTKTISDTSQGYTSTPEVSADGKTVTYSTVGVGALIEYEISYYNNKTEAVTVYITDDLDAGVTFVSASDGGAVAGELTDAANGFKYGGTVTWTLTVQPLTKVTVYLQVRVNENAKTTEAGETTATVENTAVVNGVSTETVVNPIDPDDPGDPEKEVSADSEAGVNGAAVKVGDEITYVIDYYNHNNTTAAVTITDVLEDGLTFVKALDENGDELTDAYDETTRTVTWNIASVPAFTGGTVTLVVEVNENALTELTVSNIAYVTVGNDSSYTNEPENPVDDEPEDPVKTETSVNGDAVDAVSTDTDGTITYGTVSVGDEITYTITYYNYYSVEAEITITDQLDPGVEFVSATDQTGATLTADDVFTSADDTYVKWPVFTAAAYEGGSVTLTVRVTEDAKTTGDGLSSEWADSATVDNQASVQIGNDSAVSTNIVTNPLDPDDPTEPEKTVDVGDGTQVSVGDTLVYTISYYNNLSTAATVVIEDELDEGVDYVDSTGVYDETTRTVTWTIENVSAFTEDSVTLTVTVNEKAKTADDSGNASVENDADVTVGNQAKQTTDPVENPLEPDDPTEPEKTVDVGADTKVSVGDTLVYTITYYNNLSTAATVVIEDTLDEGVDFVKASDGGVYDAATHTVTWTIEDVSAFTEGYVTLTVEVNADAQTANNSGTASVVNDADVTVGNQAKQTTDPVENPLDPDDPEDPVKTVDVGDGNAVGIGELITYTIKYYNYNNTAATVTITDVLEDGLTWVSGGTLGADGKTVTWTIENVAPYTYGTVTVTAQVNSNAKTVAEDDTSASVENTASVTVGNDAAVNTNTVTNPIDPDTPSTPTKAVSATSAAGANGESVEVGDEITYVISYYNHNNAATTVTITDTLDENVTFVFAANENGYTLPTSAYNEADHTVTWTIEAAAYETGTVTVTVKVAASAAGGKVENTASVQIGNDAAVSTNSVTNDVEETPATPSPSSSSGTTPDTGDESRLGLWIAILAAGALGLACVTVVTTSRKKRSEK